MKSIHKLALSDVFYENNSENLTLSPVIFRILVGGYISN
ncbi:hypothetical protein CLU97_3512 [Chryseobacterium sp. 7]|nr:hypothetical protein CLU97_3512 [Chryseobacterium sp. 7]